MCNILPDRHGPSQPPAGISRAVKRRQVGLVPSCPLSNSRDEAWRRLSQIFKNIIASDVDATVKLYLLFFISRTHRLMSPDILFRNLVTSLIQHEQVKTTLPKARDAARLAEKVSIFFFFRPSS